MSEFSIYFLCYRLAKNVNTVSVKKKKSAIFLREDTNAFLKSYFFMEWIEPYEWFFLFATQFADIQRFRVW